MGMMKEFKAFAMRGNVVDLAVGVIIGGAFGKIVTSVVNDIIMPPIGMVVGRVKFSDLSLELVAASKDAAGADVAAVTLNYGNFIQTIVDFLIVAFCVFLVVKAMNAVKKKEAAAPPPPAEPTREEILLTEIRDALRDKK